MLVRLNNATKSSMAICKMVWKCIFFDGKEDRDDIVYLIDYSNPDNNDFHVVNQWTFVEHSEKRPDVIVS
mgnify:CR=1 FL=1